MTALIEMGRRALPYIITVAVVAAVLFGAYRFGSSVKNAEWAAKWAMQEVKLAEDRAKAERLQREEEQRRQAAIDGVIDDAHKQIELARADAAAATAAAASLRDKAKRLAARASKACSNPQATPGSEATSSPGMVLADLFGRADQRAGELAAAYDQARAAGLACQRAYDAVMNNHADGM